MKELLDNRISQNKITRIQHYHNFLSRMYGLPIGMKTDSNYNSLDQILYDLEVGRDITYQNVTHRQNILSFMRAKDDNLILLMSGFIIQIQKNQNIWEDLVFSNFKETNSFFGSKKPKISRNCKINDLFGITDMDKDYNKNFNAPSIIKNLLSIFEIWPQYFRNFTLQNCVKVIDNFYLLDQKN